MELDTKEIGRIIYQKRHELGLTLEDIGNAVGVTKSTIQRYEAGLITSPKIAVLESIARAINLSPELLTGKKSKDMLPDTKKIAVPILGDVAAGQGAFAESNVTGYVLEDRERLSSDSEYAYLVVKGDSMYPEFKNGDKVLIKCVPTATSGDYAVVMVDDDSGVVKRIEYGDGYITLHSVNPMYPPRKFEGEEMLRIRIFGIVKGLRRSY
ncbi:MAG: S24 family peptidase [Clostridia bacterium]|nr:S24 family peptidase [Clostridia bacterium]